MKGKDVTNKEVLEFNPIKILNKESGIYLYSIKTGAMFRIDEPTARLVQTKGLSYDELYDAFKDIWDAEKFRQLIESLKKYGIIKEKIDMQIVETERKQLNMELSSIVLFMIQQCNLRCTYCYGEGGEYSKKGIISLETAMKAVDFLVENSTKKMVGITFFGGEPLMNFSLIKEVVDYAIKQGNKYEKQIQFSITTNATLLNDEITDFLVEHKFSVTISIDGCKEFHDKNRFFVDGKGTFDTVVKNTRRLVEKRPVSARATITKTNLDLVKNFYDLYELGFRRINMSPCFDMLDEEAYEEYSCNFEKLLQEYDQLLEEKKYDECKAMGEVTKKLHRVEQGGISSKFCGALINSVAVDVYGSIFPCHRFVGMDEFCVGNVYDGFDQKKYSEIAEEINIESHDKCSDCWAVNLCGGGCIFENYLASGHINVPCERQCSYTKKSFEAVSDYYVALSDEKRNVVFSKYK